MNMKLATALIATAIVLVPTLVGHGPVRPDTPAATAAAAPSAAGVPAAATASAEPSPAPMSLRLGQLVYQPGEQVTATLHLPGRQPPAGRHPAIAVAGSESGDVEVLQLLGPDASGTYVARSGVPTFPLAGDETARPADGVLSLLPGEVFHAVWSTHGVAPAHAADEDLLTDFAMAADPAAMDEAPFAVLPTLGDWRPEPAGTPKPSGAILTEAGHPVRVARHTLIFAPRDRDQLDAFLAATNGEVLMHDVLPSETSGREPSLYLVAVDTTGADLEAYPAMRRLLAQEGMVYGDSEETLRLLALATRLRLDGYAVSLNPRLEYTGVPGIHAVEAGNVRRNMTDDGPLNLPRAWAALALWDADEQRIPLAALDMGFAPNDDFREPVLQCDLEGNGLSRAVPCGPGVAVAPPTVGNSFFGSLSWHGNGVVTTAGGIINGGYGGAGVGGQVVEPMLFRYGLASYAFEIGVGIQSAARQGASVINLSAGYPCRILTELGFGIGFCAPEERAVICAVASLGLGAALDAICDVALSLGQVPGIGPIIVGIAAPACAQARDSLTIASAVCYATALLGDLRGPMERGIAAARDLGVPFVASAGNALSRSSLPEEIRDLIDLDNTVADDWNFVPAVLPHAIAAGATGDNWPFANIHFHGPSVDIWAPIRSTYFSPPTTDVVAPSEQHVRRSFGGTSAAAPYTSGLIACLQAVNPSLNPNTPGLSAAERATIVDRVTHLLTANAWTNQELVDMAPPADASATAAAGAERGNLINPLRTVMAANQAYLDAVESYGFDADDFDFDEIDAVAADTPADAIPLVAGGTVLGTIVTLRGENGAPDLSDEDWYSVTAPNTPGDVYIATFTLSTPQTGMNIDTLTTDTAGYVVDDSLAHIPEVKQVSIYSPAILAGETSTFRIVSDGSSDNYYALELTSITPIQTALPPVPLVRAGRNPLVPDAEPMGVAAVAPGLDIKRSGNQVSLQWSESGEDIVLEVCTDVKAGVWTPVPGSITVQSGALRMDVDTGASHGLFRLRAAAD